MKIEKAWVDDPLRRGELAVPIVCVQVDEPPTLSCPIETYEDGWSSAKYGPFVQYSQQDSGAIMKSPVGASDYNMAFAGQHPPVVDIKLYIESFAELSTFSLPLRRARQLLRRDAFEWRLHLSDVEAQNGGMVWTPVETRSPCKFFYHKTNQICGITAHGSINVRGFNIPYCESHMSNHNERRKQRRQSTLSK